METAFSRTELIYGESSLSKLSSLHIAVFGIGGVGSYAAESLVRTGVGTLTIVDFDTVSVSNLNRQLPALHSTIGKTKVSVMEERLKDINPDLKIHSISSLFNAGSLDACFSQEYDFVLDCIDMVTSKILLIQTCKEKGIPVISSMGMASHRDPSKIQVTDISKTFMCPLAKVLRRELKERGIKHLPVVFSSEEAIKPHQTVFSGSGKRINGSLSFVTGTAGMYMASYVINHILGEGV